jgi:outer membrane protein assembly factor BamB
MKKLLLAFLALPFLPFTLKSQPAPTPQVLTYHAGAARDGDFVVPGLTWNRARALHADTGFHARITGDVNAQPLFWHPDGSGPGLILIATEHDTIYALNAKTGATTWEKALGTPVQRSDLPCGNIFPLGITGTPVIDATRRTLYLDAMRHGERGEPEHAVFALSLQDGSVLPGWPVDVAASLESEHITFNTPYQSERGALALLDNTVYVPFGGHFGDCGNYHGWVIGLSLDAPHAVTSWQTRADGGAVWAPGGISSDGSHLFVATGNTMNSAGGRKFSAPQQWGDGEAVIRLTPDVHFSGNTADYFTPSDWAQMDDRDQDLGGIAPLLFDLPGSGGTRPLVVALGKDGKAYLLDRNRLGGIGGSLASEQVSRNPIRGAAAAVRVDDSEFIAFQGSGSNCPDAAGRGLTVIKVTTSPPAITTAWCGSVPGRGAPMVTTTNGRTDPVVWMLGAQGDNRLYGFRADTGERLFVSAALPGLQHFQTLIATPDRLYVAAANAVYAFGF